MIRRTNLHVFSAALGAAWMLCAPAQGQTPAQAPTGATAGHWIVDARLRAEGVTQNGVDDATALTFRGRVGYETPAYHGFRGLVEGEGVGHLTDEFNDGLNGQTAFASVPDPEAFELNRLQVTWSGAEARRATIGRQRIALNNARFIGNAGFRQNEQTFDALRLEGRVLPHLSLNYIYLDNIYRTPGNRSPQYRWRSDSHVLAVGADGAFGKLDGYALLLEFENAPAQSSQTYGLRWRRDFKWEPATLQLTLEAATQSDYANAPRQFDLGYQLAEAGVRHGQFGVTLGGERLEGDGVRGFSTPLGSLHLFQGWADAFVNTPPDGIRDLYLTATYNTRPWPAAQPVALTLSAHNFADDGGGRGFGDELDASARFTLGPHTALELAAAAFDSDDARFADRNKIWLSLEYKL